MISPDDPIVLVLRQAARSGEQAPVLIDLLERHLGEEAENKITQIKYLMAAFDLPLGVAVELRGWTRWGGTELRDENVNIVIMPYVCEAVGIPYHLPQKPKSSGAQKPKLTETLTERNNEDEEIGRCLLASLAYYQDPEDLDDPKPLTCWSLFVKYGVGLHLGPTEVRELEQRLTRAIPHDLPYKLKGRDDITFETVNGEFQVSAGPGLKVTGAQGEFLDQLRHLLEKFDELLSQPGENDCDESNESSYILYMLASSQLLKKETFEGVGLDAWNTLVYLMQQGHFSVAEMDQLIASIENRGKFELPTCIFDFSGEDGIFDDHFGRNHSFSKRQVAVRLSQLRTHYENLEFRSLDLKHDLLNLIGDDEESRAHLFSVLTTSQVVDVRVRDGWEALKMYGGMMKPRNQIDFSKAFEILNKVIAVGYNWGEATGPEEIRFECYNGLICVHNVRQQDNSGPQDVFLAEMEKLILRYKRALPM
jgi:hypothetical protein